MDEGSEARVVALCSGCARETGLADDQHMVEPQANRDGMACAHCGAVLAGFFYAVPEDAYSGMAPGAG